jgi:hypothetical protein
MRILGYAMLVLGFLWICFGQVAVYPIAHAVVPANYEKIPKQDSYKLEDVQKAIRDVIFDFIQHVPSFYIGALLMLAGGVVLDRAGRRKRV